MEDYSPARFGSELHQALDDMERERGPELCIEVRPLFGPFRSYLVYVIEGMLRWGPDGYGWVCLTKRGAERRGRRAMRTYAKQHEVTRVRADFSRELDPPQFEERA